MQASSALSKDIKSSVKGFKKIVSSCDINDVDASFSDNAEH